jgi:hypothetical protein
MNTLSIRDRVYLRVEAINFFCRYVVGKFVNPNLVGGRLGTFLRACRSRALRYDELQAKHSYERLPPQLLTEALELQVKQVDSKLEDRVKYAIRSFEDRGNDYADAAREVAVLLSADPMLSPVVNVGARVDVISSFLAGEFPAVQFQSVDLQPNLAEHNRILRQSANWSLHPGYVIDLLERDEIAPKLVLLMMTACKMTPREFDLFLDKANSVQAFVVIEGWKPDPMLARRSGHLTSQTLLDATLPGYFFVHDYAAKLRSRGFRIIKDDFGPTAFHVRYGAHHVVIAKR